MLRSTSLRDSSGVGIFRADRRCAKLDVLTRVGDYVSKLSAGAKVIALRSSPTSALTVVMLLAASAAAGFDANSLHGRRRLPF